MAPTKPDSDDDDDWTYEGIIYQGITTPWPHERNEIKPCPECGGKGVLMVDNWGARHSTPNHDHYMQCVDCGFRMPNVKGWEESLAIELWNNYDKKNKRGEIMKLEDINRGDELIYRLTKEKCIAIKFLNNRAKIVCYFPERQKKKKRVFIGLLQFEEEVKMLDANGDYKLLSIKNRNNGFNEIYLMMKNASTQEYHIEAVAPDTKDVNSAIKWRNNNSELPKEVS